MATKAELANIAKLQADVNKQLADLKPKVAAVQKQADPVGYAEQQLAAAKKSGTGTDIATALRELSAANTKIAQESAIKPDINAFGQARGDTLQS